MPQFEPATVSVTPPGGGFDKTRKKNALCNHKKRHIKKEGSTKKDRTKFRGEFCPVKVGSGHRQSPTLK